MQVNGLVRLAYGVGALVSPKAMAAGRLAPNTEDHPEARLFVRGFGVHQIAVAAVWLAAGRSRRLERPAMALAAGIDAVDMASAAAEALARRRPDPDTVGGFLFSGAGLVTAWAALRSAR